MTAQECADAWISGDVKARDTAARAIGITLDADVVKKIDALLVKANGKRKKFTLGVVDVLGTISDALANPLGIGVRHAGAELMGRTSLCIAVQSGDPKKKGTIVGIGSCWSDRPSPGRVWTDLQPWQQDYTKNVERAAKWAKKKGADRVLVTTGAPKKGNAKAATAAGAKKSGDAKAGAALFKQMLASPLDDSIRTVYADWLTQQGDARGELITVQLALATAKRAKKNELTKRERALRRKHEAIWMRSAMQVALDCTLERGFVSTIRATAQAFASRGATLFDNDPIETLVLSKPTAPGLKAIASSAHLAKLRRFEFSSPFYLQRAADVAALRELLLSKHLGKVKEVSLSLSHDRYLAAAMPEGAGLFDKVSLPDVEVLEIYNCPADAAREITKAKLPSLKRLVINTNKNAADPAALKKAFPKATVNEKQKKK
jgi:uncharacterized protein (TIGR02996 family)